MPTLSPQGAIRLGGTVFGAVFRDGIVWLDDYYDSVAYANKSAAIQAAADAAATAGLPLECTSNRVYNLDTTTLQLHPNTPLTINGHFATFKSTWGKPRCVDFVRVADYDTFHDIELNDLIFDANSYTATTNQGVVGNLTVSSQRVNMTNITCRRCQCINMPVGTNTTDPAYMGFVFVSTHLGASETQTNLTYIRLEQCQTRGGNVGVLIAGECTVPCEVYHDHIYVDIDHDSGIVPSTQWTSAGSAGVQLGGQGFGDICEVHIDATNVGDVGVEIDSFQHGDIWGSVTDFRVAGFFARNFHVPPGGTDNQRIVCHGTRSQIVNCQPMVGQQICQGYYIGHVTTPNPVFGEFVLEDCKHIDLSTTFTSVGGAISVMYGAQVKRVTIVGQFMASYPNINYSPVAATNGIPIFICPGSASAPEFTLGGGGDIRVVLAGAGNSNVQPKIVAITPQTGCTIVVDLGDITLESSLTGVGNAKTIGVMLGFNGHEGGSIRGRIRRIAWGHFSGGDTTPILFAPRASAGLTIDGRFVVDELDLRKDPVALPAIVNGAQAIDNTNRAKIAVRSANVGTYPIPSAAMSTSNFAAATFTSGTGNQYIDALPAEVHFATSTGANVTAIASSKDGVTYETVWTQAAGVLAQNVLVPVETGDYIKVTLSAGTTMPTVRVRRRRAQ